MSVSGRERGKWKGVVRPCKVGRGKWEAVSGLVSGGGGVEVEVERRRWGGGGGDQLVMPPRHGSRVWGVGGPTGLAALRTPGGQGS